MAKKSNNPYGFIFWLILSIVALVIIINLDDSSNKPNKPQTETVTNAESEWQDTRYRLYFGDDFKKSLASQDDLGLSILIAVDCSGSMSEQPESDPGGQAKYLVAADSLTEIVNFLADFYEKQIKQESIKLKIGLLKFNSHVKVLYDLKEVSPQTINELKAITSEPGNFIPTDKTALGETLKMGTEILAQSGTIFKSLIVITDGLNTTGDDPAEVLSAIVENRNNKNTKDFPVITNSILVSFVGFDIDSIEFSDLEQIGARVTSAANRQELNDSLKKLFLADITRLEAGE